MNSEQRECPGRETEAFEDHQARGSLSTIASDSEDLTYYCRALVVLVTDKNGKYRRRLYLSLRSAEKAVQRARARGRDAHVILCRIEPVADGDAL